MQIRNFLLLACLLAASFLKANPNPIFKPDNQTLTNRELSCNLPAPTNFHVKNWGTGWILLEWDLTNPNNMHRVNVYSCRDSSLYTSLITNVGVTQTFISINPNEAYYFEIKAICNDGGESPNAAWEACILPTGSGYILDLIVNGFHPSNSTEMCTLNLPQGGQRCYFPNSGVTTFKVRQTSNPSNFKFFGIENHPDYNDDEVFRMDVLSANGGTGYSFWVDGLPPGFGGDEAQVKYLGETVARFTAIYDETTGQSYLESVSMVPGHEIVEIQSPLGMVKPTNPTKPTGGFVHERDGGIAVNEPAFASPNPFSDALDVFPGNPSAESIHLQMYNLSGQKVHDQQFAGGQEQYSLSTAGLSNGFYLLRIEADGEVQTLKVVKSE